MRRRQTVERSDAEPKDRNRRGMRYGIEREDDLVVVGEASSEPEAEAVVRAVRAISAGESAFRSPQRGGRGASTERRTGPRQQLTDREIKVSAAARGRLSNQKIGERLLTSATTVKFHVSNIMRKLEVSRRAEAVRREQARPDPA